MLVRIATSSWVFKLYEDALKKQFEYMRNEA